MEESGKKGKRRKRVGRGRGMNRGGISDQLTHFLLWFFWWGGSSWFGGLREESSLLLRVLKQTYTRRRVGLLVRRRRQGVWGKRGEEGKGDKWELKF